MGMLLKAVGKFLLFTLRPLSKLDSALGWADIVNILIPVVYYVLLGSEYKAPTVFQGISAVWLEQNLIWFALILPIVLLLIAGIKLQYTVNTYEQTNPVIVFGIGGISKGLSYSVEGNMLDNKRTDGVKKIIGDSCFVYAFVKNDPKSGKRSENRTAKSAVVIIDIYDPNDLSKVALSYFGKWRDKPQVVSLPYDTSLSNLMELDQLPPNGMPHRIDFALKHHIDEDMYAYNDESHKYSPDGRFERFKISTKRFFVHITIKAVNLNGEPSQWYKVTHNGANSDPEITVLSHRPIM